MLSQSSLNAAYPLAEALAVKGWALKPVAETPLAQLINASLAQAETVEGVGETQLDASPSFNAMLVDSSMQSGPDGKVLHDEIMSTSVKAISNVIAGNLTLARSIVNPMIKRVFDASQEYIANRTTSSLTPMSVVPFQYKQIWSSPILRELVSRYSETSAIDPQLQPIGAVPASDLADTVLTGVGRFDEEVKLFLASGAGDRLAVIWERLFGAQAARTLSEALPPSRIAVDDVLVAFLLARRVQEEIPDGVSMDVASWRAYVSMIQAQTGRQVIRILERRELDQRNLNLVISATNAVEGEIIVVGDNYTRWLEEGGSPEVLFGSALSDRRFGYRELLDQAPQYLRVWKTEYTLRQSKIATDKFNFLIAGVGQSMTDLINELPEDELTCARPVLHERLKERLKSIKPKHLEDIYSVARKAVCRVIFPHTDVERLLDAIDAAAKQYPELDIREQALMGTISFVTSWVCKLFTVEVVPDRTGV